MKSHDKSLSPSFVLFKTLLMEMNVPFSELTQIILIEDFVQYLLDCLKRRGWESGYQLLNCPNTTVMPLTPWEVAGCGEGCFLGQAPAALAAKGVSDDWPHSYHLHSTVQMSQLKGSQTDSEQCLKNYQGEAVE